MERSLGNYHQDTENKLGRNSSYTNTGEATLYKLSQGAYVGAAVVTLPTGEEYDREDLQERTLTILQKVDYNAPQIHNAITTATRDISAYVKQMDIPQSPSHQDYFDAVMHIANTAINDQRPTQDDANRRAQIHDTFEATSDEQLPDTTIRVDQTETENLGAVVCVNKAICLYRILELHGFTDIFLNEMEAGERETDSHTNVIATAPSGQTDQYDAGVITCPPCSSDKQPK